MTARALLDTLSAAGVRVMVGAAGDTLELSGKLPPAHLLDEVRAAKSDLLAALKVAEVVTGLDNLSAPPSSSPPDPLPPHLAALMDAAHAGQLPRGAVSLASGLVTDLEGYVLAWADCWPRDRVHVLRRLEEAHAVTVRE
ncbi:hypothetical protein [Deinococcus sp.]|uniref:hypothetical protein n=1 Tax=Deinococcus sp. TaxID=47478 RepID=UPI003B5B1353